MIGLEDQIGGGSGRRTYRSERFGGVGGSVVLNLKVTATRYVSSHSQHTTRVAQK